MIDTEESIWENSGSRIDQVWNKLSHFPDGDRTTRKGSRMPWSEMDRYLEYRLDNIMFSTESILVDQSRKSERIDDTRRCT